MPTKLSAGRVRSTYEFIKAHRETFSVQAMCRVLGVAPSGYYEWLTQPISNRAQEDARLLRLIRASFIASQGIYGAPRVFLDLREAGETCSKHRVARLMRVNHLRALHGYRTRRWSVGKPSILIPNLLQRQFTVTRRNKAWVTDITYIRTWQGWLYLAIVMDLFSRKIVGWSARPTIHPELVLDAIRMAVRRRRPRGTLIHSDQGTQYGSDAWRRFCRSNHLEPSMSRKGNCWDNAVAESFFSSLKKERIKKQIYKNRELALSDVADYINRFYNRSRCHSHLGGVSPEQFAAARNRGDGVSIKSWELQSVYLARGKSRKRLDKVDFYLAVYDRAVKHHTFHDIARSLKKPLPTVKSAYLIAARNIHGLNVSPSKAEAALKSINRQTFDVDTHWLECQECANAESADQCCAVMLAYTDQDAPKRGRTRRSRRALHRD